MIKLFGFVKARGNQPARMVRVEATGRMTRDELRRKLVAISARKHRAFGAARTAVVGGPRDDQPASRRWYPPRRSGFGGARAALGHA